MEYIKLPYYTARKDDLKITPIYRDETLLHELETKSAGARSLPDVDTYYTTPVVFPKPGNERPYILSSIVLSADGKMAYMDNPEGPVIASANALDPDGAVSDFWCLNMLRSSSDAILVGANTIRKEPNALMTCMETELYRQRKEVLGKYCQPVQIIVSLDGTDIPLEHPTFHIDPAEETRVLIATSPVGWKHLKANSPLKHTLYGPITTREEADTCVLPALDREYDVFPVLVTGEGKEPDMHLMLRLLRRMGIETVCAESPAYCGALMENGCLDEYFINYSMVYVGGVCTPGHLFPQRSMDHPHADLVSVGIHHRNFLFTRQKITYGVK